MRRLLLYGLLLGVVTVAGCKSTNVVAVTLSPTAATVSLGGTQQFTAAVTGNSNTAVTWTVNSVVGGNSSVGTISTQGLYTAPVNALNASSVSVVATSVADTSKTAAATVTINSGAIVTIFCGSAACGSSGVTLGASQTFQFTDTVTNTISNLPQSTAVDWYVNGIKGGNSSSGTITTTGFYTAPGQVGSTTTFVIKAQLQADANSFGTTNAVVAPAGAPTLSFLNPSTVAQGSVFENVYLQGNNFLSTSVVRANGNPVPTSFVSPTVLRAQIPAAYLVPCAQPSPFCSIFIDVQQQSGALSAAIILKAVPAAPALISTAPDSELQNGSVQSVTFDGGYYSAATTTEFGGQVRSATAQQVGRQLNVVLNASDISTAGLFPVSVRNNSLPGQLAAANLAVSSAQAPSILTTLGVGPAPNSVAINTATGIAVVANSGTGANANTISLIDLNPAHATYLQVVGSVVVGVSPTGVAVDNIRNLAVVANSGSHSVSVVDLSVSPPVVKSTITAGLDSNPPYAVGVNSLTGQALLVYQGSSVSTIIDLTAATPAVKSTGQIQTTGLFPQVAIDPLLNWGMVTPGGNGTLSIVDLGRNGQTIVFAIAIPSSNGAVRSNGTVTIVTNGGNGSITALTTGESVVVAGVDDASFNGTFTVASATGASFTYTQAGSNATSGNGTVSVAAPLTTITVNQTIQGAGINSETQEAVLADPSSTSVSMVSLLDQSIRPISLEIGTSASAVNSLTNTAVVVNQFGGTASILNLETAQRVGSAFHVGTKPVAVAIDPVTDIAVVANQTDGTVTIIQLGAIRPLQVVQMSPFNSLTSTTNQNLTVIGNGFTGGSLVRFNESALATTFVSSRELTAVIPASLLGGPQRYVVDVLDGTAQSNVNDFTVMQAIAVGTSPRGIAIDRQRNLAVVTNSGSKSVSIINLGTLSISGTLTVGTTPQGVGLSSVAGRAAVANTDDDTVSIIDLDNIGVSSTVSVKPASGTSAPIGIAVHPGTGQVVVADSLAAQISFFDISNPATPTTLAVDAGPNAVAIDPTRNIAAVSEAGASANQVVIVDLATKQILSRVPGFQLPTGVIYDPDSDTFLVTSSLSNNFGSVFADPASQTFRLNASYRVGINPTSIDYNYRSSTLVTTNTFSQTMSVMDFLTKTIKAIIPLSVSQQFAVAIDPVTNRAIVVDQNDNQVLIVPLPK